MFMKSTIMVNIFSFDIDKYNLDEVQKIYNTIKDALPSEDILIVIPKGCNLYLDIPIETLYYYRQMFDELIDERQRRNISKNDL